MTISTKKYSLSLWACALIYPFCTLFVWMGVGLLYATTKDDLSYAHQINLQIDIYAIGLAAVLSIPISYIFIRYQRICIGGDRVTFYFTRFLIPKVRTARYTDIADFRMLDGLFGHDGRPRPVFEFDLKDGSSFWVPLPAYTIKQIREMLDDLAQRGLEATINGKTRFATGAWMGNKRYQRKQNRKSAE